MENQKEIKKDSYDSWNELFLNAGYGLLGMGQQFTRHHKEQIIGFLRKELQIHIHKNRKILRQEK